MYNKYLMGPLMEEVQDAHAGAGTNPNVANPVAASDGGLPPVNTPPPDNEVKTLKDRLNAMEQRLQNQPVPQPQRQAPAGPTITKEDINKEWYKDPSGMTSQMVQMGMQAGANNVMQTVAPTLKEFAREKARNADPALFDHLDMHIQAAVNSLPPNFHIDPAIWTNAFNTIKGEKMDEVIAFRQKSTQGNTTHVQYNATNGGPSPASHRQPPAPVVPDLTPEEKSFAAKMKLSPEEYQHGKKLYEDQDLLWDNAITFDSDVMRRKLTREREKQAATK